MFVCECDVLNGEGDTEYKHPRLKPRGYGDPIYSENFFVDSLDEAAFIMYSQFYEKIFRLYTKDA